MEGVLITNKKTYYPSYFSHFERVMSTAQIPQNYTLYDFARYDVGPNSTGAGFLIFEIGKDEIPTKFIFNTSYSLGPLYIREINLRNVVVFIT